MSQDIGEEQGYRLTFEGTSYACRTLALYGYARERALRAAVRREVTKREKRRAKISEGWGRLA